MLAWLIDRILRRVLGPDLWWTALEAMGVRRVEEVA